ncbi:MAG: hypothetical protein R3E65_09705 [Steroidobacteraceae bacterium]
MSESSQRKPLRRTIRGGRPFFFSDPAIDKVLNITITLASEVWALRERLSALEGVQVRQGSLSATEIDDYEFTPEQEERLGAQRREFIENLFRVLQETVDAAAAASGRGAGSGTGPVFGARISRVARSAPARKPARKPKRKTAKRRTPAGRRRS